MTRPPLSPNRRSLGLGGLPFVAGLLAVFAPPPGAAQSEPAPPSCYPTAGGALEICRSVNEPEGVLYAPPPCHFGYGVQIIRLKARSAPGPLQVVFHAEPPGAVGRSRRDEACDPDLRATDPAAGGSVRTGRLPEQLAGTMPPTEPRFWAGSSREEAKQSRSRRAGRRTGRGRDAAPLEFQPAAGGREGVGARDPMTVAGRDWAGDDYHYVFMIATEAFGEERRHALVQARTLDFETFEVRRRTGETGATAWVPFDEGRMTTRRHRRSRAARRSQPPSLAPVLDEAGKPIVGNCTGQGFDVQGLVGSISVVDQVYHYFYTDVLPSECAKPPAKRRLGLYLRTSRDLAAETVWSAPQAVLEALPPDTLVRVGEARGMDRWAIAYSCYRPANAPGGPVADICLHYSADLSLGSFKSLTLFAEPTEAARSPAYLALRSGGDGGGRFSRDGFFWMTDRYGNLDTPVAYPLKGGFLTWFDRLAPRADGRQGSSLYGRPVYWSTWTVRPR